jgi:hypothetical protein
MRPFLLISLTVCAWAQSGIEVPAIGAMVDSSGGLRPVEGVAGNFLLGPATLPGVLSAACSQQLCLAKTDSKIFSPSGETDAPAGPAVFGLSGSDAVVFFPEPREFARWHDNTLDPLDWVIDGEVLSIRLSGQDAEIAVRREGSVWMVRPDGAPAGWIADTGGPALLFEEGVLYATADEIVLRRRDASEMRFELAGAEAIAAMGPHYAAIRKGGSTYALRTESGREQLFVLPGNAP